jgi:hypothetical protein
MGVEHVYVEYDPAKPTNRYDLGTRRLVHTIELEHFRTMMAVTVSAPAPAPAPSSGAPAPAPAQAPAPAPAQAPAPAPTVLNPVITSFTASPNPVRRHEITTITAIFSNGSGDAGDLADVISSGVGIGRMYGSRNYHTYTLTVTNSVGVSVSRSLTIQVL